MSEKIKKSKYMQKVMFFFAVLLVTVVLIGCSSDATTTAITGTFSYTDIIITAGTAIGATPIWIDATAGQVVNYSIEPAIGGDMPTGITVGTDGTVTLGTDATEQVATEYTVTATGTGNYTGTIEGTVNIIIDAPDGSNEIADVQTGTMTVGTAIADIDVSVNFTDEYGTLAYTANGLPDGLSISTTGVISGIPTGTAGTATVSVTATSVGTIAEGHWNGIAIFATFTIVVDAATVANNLPIVETEIADVPTGTMTIGTAIDDIDVSDNFTDADGDVLTFTVDDGLPAGLVFSSTGVISGTPTGPAETATVTVTANDGNVGGTISDTFTIVVDAIAITGTFSYTDIIITAGTAIEATPIWIDATAGQAVDYSIEPAIGGDMPTGITVGTDGTVTVGTDATEQVATEYTVTATGTGNYTGTIEGTVNITITPVEQALFTLSSISFNGGATIPDRYSPYGDGSGNANISPQLQWVNPPSGTLSYAIIMDDPDAFAHAGYTWTHWNVYQIAKDVTEISEGASSSNMPTGSVEGRNSNPGNPYGYTGPAPPIGDQNHTFHTYHFYIYALNIETLGVDVNLDTPMTRSSFESSFSDKIIGQAGLTGTYTYIF